METQPGKDAEPRPDRENDPDYVAAVWRRRAEALRADAAFERDPSGAPSPGDAEPFLAVLVGGERFAFPLGHVVEIVDVADGERGTTVPDAPPEFWGLVVIRGEVRPAFDTAVLLGTAREMAPRGDAAVARGKHIVLLQENARRGAVAAHLLDAAENLAGMVVDEALGIVHGKPEQTDAESRGGSLNLVSGIVRLPPERKDGTEQTASAESAIAGVVSVAALMGRLRRDAAAESALAGEPEGDPVPSSESARPNEELTGN